MADPADRVLMDEATLLQVLASSPANGVLVRRLSDLYQIPVEVDGWED